MTLTNVVRTIFYHLRNGQKIVRTTFVRVIVTKPLVRQCHFQNLVLFRPHRTLEHNKIVTSRPPVARTEHLL